MSLKTVFISTYTFIREGRRTNDAGPVKPLRDYFAQRSAAVCLMEQPLPGSDHLHPILTDFRSGRLHRQSRLPMTLRLGKGTASFDSNRTYLRLKLRDLLSNAWALLKTRACHRRTGIDLFVGVESLNALCGILFKRLGLVRAVVYYVFDWAPDRFANPLMNAVYLWMDRMATYYSDATWNITYAIGDARRDLLHYPPGRMSPQIYVPYSPGLPNVPGAAVEKADDNLIIYAGGLIPENGPDLLLQA
ncbi:MAG: glycosyltransferase family 4 protein, partial [Desulfobacterales bacterium]|nr:glycosyltransferase family 4 protein [Desulfobacterales bacterium]